MKKVTYEIKVNHVVDLITNSSSELFVIKASTKEIVIEMIKEVYPNYLDEYHEVESLSDKSFTDLEDWLSERLPWSMDYIEANSHLLDGVDFEEMFKISEWDKKQYNKEVWSLKRGFITPEIREALLDQHDPNREIWNLQSIYDNPNQEMQEALSQIGDRYHQG